MADHDDPHLDDDALAARFERVVELTDAPAPTLDELEGRVTALAERRRRAQRRTAVLAAAAVLVVLVAVGALVSPWSTPDADEVITATTGTTLPIDPKADPVFTIGDVPAGLAFRACDPTLDPDGPARIAVSCSYDDPSTPASDGVRVTRVVGGATAEVQAAWAAGDAEAAATATGAGSDPTAASFRTLGGAQVLDLTPGGTPSGVSSAALQLLVGDDLVDVGASSVTLDELESIVAGIGLRPPSTVVSDALAILPTGTEVLVQGPRPLWVQVDPIRPEDAVPFEGATEGAELIVPGASDAIGVDVTTGIDADALLDSILATGDPGLTETELGGRRAVVLAADGMLPRTIPEPRAGPQALVRLDAGTVVRVRAPGGSPEQVAAVAAAFR